TLGFEKARQVLVNQVDQDSQRISQLLKEMGRMMTSRDEKSKLVAIDLDNSDFHEYFQNAVEKMEFRGFKDAGVEGTFRAKVHEIEQAVEKLHSDHLMVDMLMIRRHEKDYLLRGEKQYVDGVVDAIATLKTDVANSGIAAGEKKELNDLADGYLTNFRKLVALDSQIADDTANYRKTIADMKGPLDAVIEQAVSNENSGLARLMASARESMTLIGAIGVAAVVLGMLLAVMLARIIARPIIAITGMVRNMAAGSLDEPLTVTSRDEIGQLSRSMFDMQGRLKTIIETEISGIIRDAGDGNLANRLELDGKTGFYRNLAQSINELISVNERFLNDTASVVSGLAAGRLDTNLADSYRGKFAQVQGDIGRMRDNLVQVINRDVQTIVAAAARGDLDHSVELHGKHGFYLELSQSINTLVETNASIINDCIRVIGGLSSGSFDEKFARQYQGSFGQLQQYVQRMQDNLQSAIEREIQAIVGAAANGNLKQRIAVEHKQGFYRTLSDSINQLVDTSDRIISDTSRVVGALAKGDLTQTIARDYNGTFDQLKRDINQTVAELIATVESIQKAASSVETGAGEIASGNTNLSQRTEEQAASLEETSAAIEELTTTVQQTADNTTLANTLSKESIDTAVKGGNVVNAAIRSMELIHDSSGRIAEIVGVIDEIAFQTNLLALNASVEAARAGEQGKGFAVVADEVRVLAGRCAKAAKEIKELIATSSDNVKAGSELANKSGAALQEIIVAARKVNGIVSEISTACEEQARGIREIHHTLTQMDDVTQQNAALVEEAAAASESLSDQSRELNSLVGFFRLPQGRSFGQGKRLIA
ncbi:MAG TPA: methyl-accepting chemotaxis protein, partial [Candidatus Acidoferrum sp.]|nr:methyl-accepting chemotaxis protein [Candidatus Acidoferrum sp.]